MEQDLKPNYTLFQIKLTFLTIPRFFRLFKKKRSRLFDEIRTCVVGGCRRICGRR